MTPGKFVPSNRLCLFSQFKVYGYPLGLTGIKADIYFYVAQIIDLVVKQLVYLHFSWPQYLGHPTKQPPHFDSKKKMLCAFHLHNSTCQKK